MLVPFAMDEDIPADIHMYYWRARSDGENSWEDRAHFIMGTSSVFRLFFDYALVTYDNFILELYMYTWRERQDAGQGCEDHTIFIMDTSSVVCTVEEQEIHLVLQTKIQLSSWNV